jgi:hypothetical protein
MLVFLAGAPVAAGALPGPGPLHTGGQPSAEIPWLLAPVGLAPEAPDWPAPVTAPLALRDVAGAVPLPSAVMVVRPDRARFVPAPDRLVVERRLVAAGCW